MVDEKSNFKVTDRRIFGPDGQPLNPSETEDSTTQDFEASSDFSSALDDIQKGSLPFGEANFQMLILSLSTSALVQLGIAPNPENGKTEKDLTSAKQTIDILGILQEKTKGNLTPEEQRLLDQCLYDLKMSYLSLVKK